MTVKCPKCRSTRVRKWFDTYWCDECNHRFDPRPWPVRTIARIWRDDSELVVMIGVILVLVIAAGGLIFGMVHYGRKWEEFKIAHECKTIGYIAPSNGYGFDGKIILNPSKTGYRCNDGLEYWK